MANPMDSFKKLPTWGKVLVAVGGAGAVYLVYRNHSGSSSSASGMVTDPSTGEQYPAGSTDPVTDETYGQEIAQYGSVEAADEAAANGQSSLLGSGDLFGTGYDAGAYNSGGYGTTTTVSGSTYTSDSAWAQAATAGLTEIGYSGTQVSEALGLYLTNSPVTPDEAAIIRTAIAEYGNPPVGTYQIILQPSKAATVKVPSVIGLDLTNAQNDLAYAGLKSSASGPVFTKGTGTRVVTAQSPAAGTSVTSGSSVHLTYKVEGAKTEPKTGTPGGSKGTEVRVPDVVGKTQSSAFSAISRAGLHPSYGDSPPVKGKVLHVESQSPAAGAEVSRGSTVTVHSK